MNMVVAYQNWVLWDHFGSDPNDPCLCRDSKYDTRNTQSILFCHARADHRIKWGFLVVHWSNKKLHALQRGYITVRYGVCIANTNRLMAPGVISYCYQLVSLLIH